MILKFVVIVVALAATLASVCAFAAVPSTVTLDGRLLTVGGGPAADGDYSVTFSLYAAIDSPAAAWQEAVAKLAVKDGGFSYDLGAVKALDQALLAAGKAQFVGVTVAADPELPRTPFNAVMYARRAQVAELLDCSGCVTADMLSAAVLAPFAKSADLAAYAKSVDFAAYAKLADLGAYAKAADLAAYTPTVKLATVATTGNYGALIGLPVLAKVGAACGSGLVVSGIKVDGSLDCVAAAVGGKCAPGQAVTEVKSDGSVVCTAVSAALPADGLAAVSNGILTNVFPAIFPSLTAPKAIPDNDAFGIIDDIIVPDKGVVTALSVAIDLTSSDISGLKVSLLDPTGKNYVLYDGTLQGAALKASYPDGTKPASGDLTTWIGANPKGKWRLQVVDNKAGPGGNDGQLNAWGITVKTLSAGVVEVKGDLNIDGGLTVGGKVLPQVWTASNDTLAPGATLDIDTKLGDQTLAVSAWVKVGNDWRLISPNATETACPACGTGQDGDFVPTSSTVLQGNRFYSFRSITIPKGITLSVTGGPLLLGASSTIQVFGTIQADGSGPSGQGNCNNAAYIGGSPGGGGAPGGNGSLAAGSGKTGGGLGGGGGGDSAGNLNTGPNGAGGGGGGGFGAAGQTGFQAVPNGGGAYGQSTTYGLLGGGSGGGGGGGYGSSSCGNTYGALSGGGGGGGGGALLVVAPRINVGASGLISAKGGAGGCGVHSGGGGSGGHIWLRGAVVTITGTVSALGGNGGGCAPVGGNGGNGWINVDGISVSGNTTPAATSIGLDGLPGADASAFTLTTTNGVAHLKNEGQVARQVRLVVVR